MQVQRGNPKRVRPQSEAEVKKKTRELTNNQVSRQETEKTNPKRKVPITARQMSIITAETWKASKGAMHQTRHFTLGTTLGPKLLVSDEAEK